MDRQWNQRSWWLYNNTRTLDFFPISTWPEYLRVIAMTENPSHRDIYVLFKFFVCNGLDPRIASNYMVDNYNYDKYQAMWLENHAYTYTTKYFDMLLRRVV